MKEVFSTLGCIGFLIVTGITIYNLFSGRPVAQVGFPGGSTVTFGTPTLEPRVSEPTVSPTQAKTPEPEVSTKPEETPSSQQEIITESPLPTPEPEVTTKPEVTPNPEPPIPESPSLDISGEWQLLDTNSNRLKLVIQQNEKNIQMKVYDYDFNGYSNTWIFEGIIDGNKIIGNSENLSVRFRGLRGRGNLEVSSNADKITGSFVYFNGSESPFLAHR